MQDYLILNLLDKSNREFKDSQDLSNYGVVDWYGVGPTLPAPINPSSFPTALVYLPATGGLLSSWETIDGFNSIEELAAKKEIIWQKKVVIGSTTPIPSAAPEYEKFLYLLSINQFLPLEILPFVGLFTQDPSGLVDDQKRFAFWQKLTANPAYFMTPEVIALIENIASACHIVLSPPKEQP